ncbi:MAG: DUF4190 domain-containing protein [bacterium]|nr:MAG: DUF4190 domain-containing protein [bacterium]
MRIKTSKLAISSLVISLLALISYQASLMAVGLENSLPIWIKTYIPERVLIMLISIPIAMGFILAFCGVILGVVSLLRIKKSKEQLAGKKVAITGLVLGTAFLFYEVVGTLFMFLCFVAGKD